MKTKPIVLASLLMAIMSCLGLWQYEKSLSNHDQIQSRIQKISQNYYDEKLKNELIVARLKEFQQDVALHIPGKKFPFELDLPLRDLASVIPHQKNNVTGTIFASRKILEKGHGFFKEKKYAEAIKAYLDLVSDYPESAALLEANYHLVYCFYATGNKQEALDWSDKMLTQFPESLWTAKAMLVAADIYNDQKRRNDAIDVYQIILDTFNDKDLREEVQKRISSAGL